MQKAKRGVFAYFGMDLDDGDDEVGGCGAHGHVGVTSRGLGGRVLALRKDPLCHTFKFAVVFQALFTL